MKQPAILLILVSLQLLSVVVYSQKKSEVSPKTANASTLGEALPFRGLKIHIQSVFNYLVPATLSIKAEDRHICLQPDRFIESSKPFPCIKLVYQKIKPEKSIISYGKK